MGRDTGNLKSKCVEKLIRAGKPGKHYDGQGLRLEIRGPNNSSWVGRYQVDGVTRYMGLGSAKTFNLTEARERNRRLVRQKVADGLDPECGRSSIGDSHTSKNSRLCAEPARTMLTRRTPCIGSN